MSNNNVPTWPARAGIGGFVVWIGVVIGVVALGGFVYTLVTSVL
ncbi:hypothetical protein GCM10027416_08870 [Okibacterium endophyticum]